MEARRTLIQHGRGRIHAGAWSLQPDSLLCRAAQHGSESAFSELHRRHAPAVRAFVFHLLGRRDRREDAEDVVQDAFARAFDAIAGQGFEGDFKHWLFAIARNRSIDLLRSERVRLVSLESAGLESNPPAADQAASPPAVAETRDELAWLVNAIDGLPERQRSALLLRELAGFSHLAIAEELGTTTASARQLITRGRDGVRSAAERDGRGHRTKSRRSLRRELLDAVPMVPLAAAGLVTTTGTAAGGSLAAGKLLAAVLAALVLAGTAGPVTHQFAGASESPRRSGSHSTAIAPAPAPQKAASEHAASNTHRTEKPRTGSRFATGAIPKAKTKTPPGAVRLESGRPASGNEHPAQQKIDVTGTPAKVVPTVVQPVEDVTALSGDVVGDVTDTLGDETSDLTGSGSH
jgi:RNA polymerase sigma factor (sigma-70 family)